MTSRKKLSAEQVSSSPWDSREQVMPPQPSQPWQSPIRQPSMNTVNTQGFQSSEQEQPCPSGESTPSNPVEAGRAKLSSRRRRQRYNRSLKSGLNSHD